MRKPCQEEDAVKMPCVNVEIQKVILPSVSQILYQVETIVSSSSQSLDEATDLWWDKSEVHLEESYGQDDSHHSDVFLFSDATFVNIIKTITFIVPFVPLLWFVSQVLKVILGGII